jgi:hypothetical protein
MNEEEMNEMEYIGTNTGLNLNPAGLIVYRKKQYHEISTLARVGHPLNILNFYKHAMPPASTKRIILIQMGE